MNAFTDPAISGIPCLLNHQVASIDDAVAELKTADRCQVLMACGTGKTRVGAEIALALKTRSVVVFLPSLALVRQTLPDWIKRFAGNMTYLCVCSDSTVSQRGGQDEAIVTPEEIRAEFGLSQTSVTTDSDVVRQFLSLPGFYGTRIVFSTYQSSDVVARGCPDDFAFDLGIFDEAHRTTGKNSAFSAPLEDGHTPIAKRLYLTATPKHVTFRKRTKDGEPRVTFSMDDEALYGRVAHRLPIRHAIEAGIIAGYKVIVYSACPVVNISQETFIQWVSVGGERQRMEFTRRILWLQRSETQILYRHGGHVLQEGETCNDFYGYLSSSGLHQPSPAELATYCGITEDSSLELVLQATVFLQPVVETEETIKHNQTKADNYKSQYAYVPDEWRKEIVEDGQRMLRTLGKITLGEGVVWSSKNTPAENTRLKHLFGLQWRVANDLVFGGAPCATLASQ